MLLAQSDEDYIKAGRVLTNCDLEQVTLSGCVAESSGDEEYTNPLTLEFLDPSAKSLGVKNGSLFAESTFRMESFDSSEPKRLVFRVSCSFRLRYGLEAGFNAEEEELQSFANAYGVFNSWPYIRELVQDLTRRMGAYPPPLPLLRLGPAPKTGDEDSLHSGLMPTPKARKRRPRPKKLTR